MTDKYKAKGQLLFRLGPDGIEAQVYDRDYYLQREQYYISDKKMCEEMVDQMYRWDFEKDIYNLFDGKEFLKLAQEGSFIDYDGSISTVFVDGYISNLGLATDNLTQGKFLVGAEVWEDICNEFKVEVNWANK